jgi:hypothetical protein
MFLRGQHGARPVEEVFDYVADERHEPNFNTRMSRVGRSAETAG